MNATSMTTTVVPDGAAAGGGAAGTGALGRGTIGGDWATTGVIQPRIETRPATDVARRRESLTRSSLLVTGRPDRRRLTGWGYAARRNRLRETSPGARPRVTYCAG